MFRKSSLIAAALLAVALSAGPAAPQSRVAAGLLECRLAQGSSFIIGSVRDFDCLFRPVDSRPQEYRAIARRVGLDLGFSTEAGMVWTVFAPTNLIGPGALQGGYVGVSGGVAIGVGIGANALIGGVNNSFALQPLSVEGQSGLNIAAGVASLELHFMR